VVDFSTPSYKINLTGAPIEFAEVRAFLPDFIVHGAPEIGLKAIYQNDSL
jgi:hypothetical protein